MKQPTGLPEGNRGTNPQSLHEAFRAKFGMESDPAARRFDVPCVAILNDADAGDPQRCRAEIITQGAVTVGVIFMPATWMNHPQEAGTRLVVPPDQMGWELLDWMHEAGVGEVEVRAV